MADIIRYIRQLSSIVDYYQNLETEDDTEENE